MIATKKVRLERVELGGGAAVREAGVDELAAEAPLAVFARGQRVLTLMRTPGHDLELVAGLFHGEGLPRTALVERPRSQGSDDDEGGVEVDLDPSQLAPRPLTSNAGCGVCGRQVIADLERRARSVGSDLIVPAARLAELPERLRQRQTLFAATGGLHGAALATTAGELLVAREDIGRHNAVDKVVGWALARGQPAGRLVLVVSGRLGYEIVQKAVAFGCPVVVAVSAPSSLAVEVAERFRVALCGFARGERFNVYSHGWRVD